MKQIRSINEWCEFIHQWAKDKGWWSKPQDTVAAKLLMVHTEVSEATEELRQAPPCPKGGMEVDYDHLRGKWVEDGRKPVGFATELADTVIRCMDLAGRLGIDLEDEIERKMLYNLSRDVRHGNKGY